MHPPKASYGVYTSYRITNKFLNYPTLTLPDILGRELEFLVSPQYIGGIKGGKYMQLHKETV
jgi:hypothetical protein